MIKISHRSDSNIFIIIFKLIMNRDNCNYPPQVDPTSNYDYRNPNVNIKNFPPSESLPGHSIPLLYPPSAFFTPPQFSYFPPSVMVSHPLQKPNFNPKYSIYEDQSRYCKTYEQIPINHHQKNMHPNIVQKIAFLIEAELPYLRLIMSLAVCPSRKALEQRLARSQSSSHSRSRSRNKRTGANYSWLCQKCYFTNYGWRNYCRKCNQNRDFRSPTSNKPKEWKCASCQYFNSSNLEVCDRCGKAKFSD